MMDSEDRMQQNVEQFLAERVGLDAGGRLSREEVWRGYVAHTGEIGRSRSYRKQVLALVNKMARARYSEYGDSPPKRTWGFITGVYFKDGGQFAAAYWEEVELQFAGANK